ncbi:FAD-dependent oxidoreductase [Streptomyces sp. NPDC057280]|jgi:2-polyprenyl-6-methoxyphenol hydroxylase-like FAD-dependent oxidoreductase|uniref:FAD-dependent oxidoreductase n=1 Tax=Streptomyces sp. NPDC057280 TaxID=3346081 RepID=UPI00362D14A5
MSLNPGARGGHGGADHAVVIGSSLAGMAAAQALSPYLSKVTVIERDQLSVEPRWRRGVAQARHAHNLMAAGHRGLEQLFPGITDELITAGMVRVRMPEDMLLLAPGGWMSRFETDMAMLTGTRDVIDAVVRERLRKNPKVEFVTEHEALGLQGGRDGGVVGVWVRGKDGEARTGWGEKYLIDADFVVDATGRKSKAPQWLEELGYERPRESVVDAKTAYATSVYEPPADHVADWSCMLLMASPQTPRQGILNPIEGGRWMVSVSASGGDRPPTDHEGLLRAAGTLRDPVLRDVVETATPVGPVYGSGRTENRWRHYEKLSRWPDGFLVIGDAFGGFNPSYGQGMSVAVQCALVLRDRLAARGTHVGQAGALRKAFARTMTPAWQLATGMDFSYPWVYEVTRPDVVTRLGKRYVDRLAAAAVTDRHAATLMLQHTQLIASPTAMFHPRVIAAALRGPSGPGPVGPPSTTHGLGARRSQAEEREATNIADLSARRSTGPAQPAPEQVPTAAAPSTPGTPVHNARRTP